MRKISLIAVNENDWKELVEIEKASISKTVYFSTEEKKVKNYINKSSVLFISINSEKVGTIAFSKNDDGSMYIGDLSVLPKHRRKGIATSALNKVLEMLSQEATFSLTVHPENTYAIIIYLKLGFVVSGWKDDFWGDGEPRLVLRKDNSN